jgi:hypothetical protein
VVVSIFHPLIVKKILRNPVSLPRHIRKGTIRAKFDWRYSHGHKSLAKSIRSCEKLCEQEQPRRIPSQPKSNFAPIEKLVNHFNVHSFNVCTRASQALPCPSNSRIENRAVSPAPRSP